MRKPALVVALGALALASLACGKTSSSLEAPRPVAAPGPAAASAKPAAVANPAEKASRGAGSHAPEGIVVTDVAIAPKGPITVQFAWKVPAGTGVNEDAPFRARFFSSDGLEAPPEPQRATGAAVQEGFQVSISPIARVAGARLGGEVDVILCDTETHKVCTPVKRRFDVTFRTDAAGPTVAKVEMPLPSALEGH